MARMLLVVLAVSLAASTLVAAPAAPPPTTIAALQLELDGVPALYSRCDSIGSESEVIESTSGSSGVTSKTPGKTRFLNITCSRPLSSDKSLWTWRKQIETGTLPRKNGAVILLDSTLQEVARFNFGNGWPQSLKIDAVDPGNSEPVMETVSIVIESLERP